MLSFLLMSFLLSSPVFATTGINGQINFQGKLVNSDGTTVSDNSYTVVFSLYTVSSGGSNIWTETDSVTTTTGIFQVTLGAVTSLSSVNFNQNPLYLGIQVGSDSEMTPRILFAAVPYAFTAQQVNGLTVTNNGGNTLTIAANKTLTVQNTLTLNGTDGTTFTLPSTTNGTILTTNQSSQTIASNQTSGTILTENYGSATTLSGQTTGELIDLQTNVTATNQSVTDISLKLPGPTNTNTSGTNLLQGLVFSGSAVTQNGTGGTTTVNGISLTNPNITQTAGTISSNGLSITTGTNTTGGTQNGISITPTTISAGTLNGINIGSVGSGGTTTAIVVGGTSWGNALTVGGNAIVNGSGVLQSAGLSGTYSNALTLSSGSNVYTGSTLSLTPVSNTTGLTITGTNVTSANLLNLSSNNTSGTLFNQSFGSATTLGGATTGHTLDMSTNVTATNQNVTGINLVLPGPTNTNTSGTELVKGFIITSGAGVTQNGSGGSTTDNSIDVTVPALTLTTGTTLLGNGVSITGGNITQSAGSLTENGLSINLSNSTITTGGTLNGLKILSPTTAQASGTTNAIFLGTSTNATANTGDSATISVGNIASTSQQNRSTLIIQNSGTGYFDLELVKGFVNNQGTNTFQDDFMTKALDTNKWTTPVCGTGASAAISTATVNGVMLFTSGTSSGSGCTLATQTTFTNGFIKAANNPIYEANVQLASTASTQRAYFGFSAAALTGDTNTGLHAVIEKRAADTVWQCSVANGTTETITSTGVSISTASFQRLRVTVQTGTTPQVICSVGGTSVSVTSNAPGSGTGIMDIFNRVESTGTSVANHALDYVHVWQDDPVGLTLTQNELSPINQNTNPTAQDDTLSQQATNPALSIQPPQFASLAVNGQATVSSDLTVSGNSLFQNLLTVLSTVTTQNLLVKNIATFLQSALFQSDVTIQGHLTVNQDTGGYALIAQGTQSVTVVFTKPYVFSPIVSVTMVGIQTPTPDIGQLFSQGYFSFVTNVSTNGFTIQLNKPAQSDISFSWVALEVPNVTPVQSTNQPPSPSLSPTVTPTIFATPTMPAPLPNEPPATQSAQASDSALLQ